MTIEELSVWLTEEIEYTEDELRKVIEANSKMPIPDRVSRRVVETKILAYRIVRDKIKRVKIRS